MPLPEGFSEVENLQDLILVEHNKQVREWFKNQQDDDVSTPKARLKHSCIIKDTDSLPVTMARLWLFEFIVGQAKSVQPNVILAPDTTAVNSTKYKPQVQLFFKESVTASTYDPEFRPVTGEISFRLMDETNESISRSKAELLATKIKQIFATPIVVWEKGWFYASYVDVEKGYRLKILSKSQTEAKRIINLVLDIQSHSFDKDKYTFSEHERTFPAVPPTQRIYGRTRKVSRERPRADVKFHWAKLLIFGLANPINLVDASGMLRSVIERV